MKAVLLLALAVCAVAQDFTGLATDDDVDASAVQSGALRGAEQQMPLGLPVLERNLARSCSSARSLFCDVS